MVNEFRKASERKKSWKDIKPKVKERLNQVPKSREGRMAAIIATIEAHPEGLNLTAIINRFTEFFGMRRKTVAGYFKELSRIGMIHVKRNMKVYPKEE